MKQIVQLLAYSKNSQIRSSKQIIITVSSESAEHQNLLASEQKQKNKYIYIYAKTAFGAGDLFMRHVE